MSASRVDNPTEIVDVGEQVWIKVIGREVNTQHAAQLKCIVQKQNKQNIL